MNFSKLPKEKRTQLIIVIVLALVALGGLGFGLIRWQFKRLTTLAEKAEIAEKRLKQVKTAIANEEQIESEFTAKNKLLAGQEENMASGDHFSWAVNLLRRFKLSYKVDLPQIGQPTPESDMNLLPRFPYKQVSLRVGGTAYYNDFGKFIADLENHFPQIRVLNLNLEPESGSGDKEKLSFSMDIVALVKPTNP